MRLHDDLQNRRDDVEAQKVISGQQQARLWTKRDRLRDDRNNLEHSRETIRRNQDLLDNRVREMEKREELRKRQRSVRSI